MASANARERNPDISCPLKSSFLIERSSARRALPMTDRELTCICAHGSSHAPVQRQNGWADCRPRSRGEGFVLGSRRIARCHDVHGAQASRRLCRRGGHPDIRACWETAWFRPWPAVSVFPRFVNPSGMRGSASTAYTHSFGAQAKDLRIGYSSCLQRKAAGDHRPTPAGRQQPFRALRVC